MTMSVPLNRRQSLKFGASSGVAMAPGPYEALFPSLAHTWDEIERTAELAAQAAREVATTAG